MKKIWIFIITLFFITGCSLKESEYRANTIHYQLNISNYYQEKITFTFPKNAYDIASTHLDSDYDSLEFILLVDNFSRPIHNNLYSFYNKNITRLKDAIEVTLDYNYTEKDFANSNYINTCFEKHTIKDNEDYFEIRLSGEFYCLQDKDMTIEVTSENSEIYSNGTPSNEGIQWKIDNTNKNNVDIYYKVNRKKNEMLTSYGSITNQTINTDNIVIYEFFIIVAVLIVGFFFYKFLYNKEFNR